jgi:hypothetical protein
MRETPFQFSLLQMLCAVTWFCVAVWAVGRRPLDNGTCVESMIVGPAAIGLLAGTISKRPELGVVAGVASLPFIAILMYVRAGLDL